MKGFFGQMFASLIGFLLGLFLLFFIGFITITGIIASAGKETSTKVKSNSVLKIKFEGSIKERASKDKWAKMQTGFGLADGAIALDEMIAVIRKAKDDANIKGLYLDMHLFTGGLASMTAIRKELVDFKKSGKFIYAYSEMISEKGYYIASTADSVFLYPTGFIEWNGLNSNPMYIKGMLEKWNIEPRVFKVGKFKAGAEMFTEKQMSDMNRIQMKTLLDDFWNHLVVTVSEKRKINRDSLDAIASELKITDGKGAVKYKLIDALYFPDQVEDLLKSRTKTDKKAKLNEVSYSDYAKNVRIEGSGKNLSNKIAVIYATGEIRSGKGNEETIGSETLCEAIKEAREDENVKAIVLRVNSPGGSALASDVIGREVQMAKKVKTVVASYGDVAASGGYYISAGCDKIFAEPTTITGSIGVFGLLMNTQKFFSQEIGITFDRVYSSKNQYADLGDPNKPMTDFEAQTIQKGVNKVYGEFVEVVKTGRHFPDSVAVDSIAQGRVWSGNRALTIKLIDEIGGLDQAIEFAAKKAGLSKGDYSLVDYPEHKGFLERILEDTKSRMENNVLMKYLPKEHFNLLKILKTLEDDPRGIYVREFWDFQFD